MLSGAFTPANKRSTRLVSVKHTITPPLFAKALCQEIIYTESFCFQHFQHKVTSSSGDPAVSVYTNQWGCCFGGSNMKFINLVYYIWTLLLNFFYVARGKWNQKANSFNNGILLLFSTGGAGWHHAVCKLDCAHKCLTFNFTGTKRLAGKHTLKIMSINAHRRMIWIF